MNDIHSSQRAYVESPTLHNRLVKSRIVSGYTSPFAKLFNRTTTGNNNNDNKTKIPKHQQSVTSVEKPKEKINTTVPSTTPIRIQDLNKSKSVAITPNIKNNSSVEATNKILNTNLDLEFKLTENSSTREKNDLENIDLQITTNNKSIENLATTNNIDQGNELDTSIEANKMQANQIRNYYQAPASSSMVNNHNNQKISSNVYNHSSTSSPIIKKNPAYPVTHAAANTHTYSPKSAAHNFDGNLRKPVLPDVNTSNPNVIAQNFSNAHNPSAPYKYPIKNTFISSRKGSMFQRFNNKDANPDFNEEADKNQIELQNRYFHNTNNINNSNSSNSKSISNVNRFVENINKMTRNSPNQVLPRPYNNYSYSNLPKNSSLAGSQAVVRDPSRQNNVSYATNSTYVSQYSNQQSQNNNSSQRGPRALYRNENKERIYRHSSAGSGSDLRNISGGNINQRPDSYRSASHHASGYHSDHESNYYSNPDKINNAGVNSSSRKSSTTLYNMSSLPSRRSLPNSTTPTQNQSQSASNQKKPPSFLVRPCNQTLNIGEKLQLQAQLSSESPIRAFTWLKDSCYVDEDEGFKEYNVNDLYYLEKNCVEREDAGNYKLQVCNKCGEASASARVEIEDQNYQKHQNQPQHQHQLGPVSSPYASSHHSTQKAKSVGELTKNNQNDQNYLSGASNPNLDQSSQHHQKSLPDFQQQIQPSITAKFTEPLTDKKLLTGEYLTLEAYYQGYPEPKVFWIAKKINDNNKNNQILNKAHMIAVGGRARLRISPHVLKIGTYNFSCVLQDASVKNTNSNDDNEPLDITSCNIIVEPKPYEPRFIQRLAESYQINEHHNLKLECQVDSRPGSEFQWFVNGNQVVSCERTKIISDVSELKNSGNNNNDGTSSSGYIGKSVLYLNRVDPTMNGIVKFIAKNSQGTCRCSSRIEVKPLPIVPPKFLFNSMVRDSNPGGILHIEELKDLTFSVEITGDPRPIVTWLFNEERFEPDEHEGIIIKADGMKHSLTIQTVQYKEDSGRYTVHLKNSGGAISTSCRVEVTQKAIEPEPEPERQIEKKPETKPVKFKPQIHQSIPKSITLIGGQDAIKLTAKTYGYPLPQTYWLIGGEMVSDDFIENSENESGILMTTLEIPESGVTEELDGELIELLIENEEGRIELQSLIKVVEAQKPQIQQQQQQQPETIPKMAEIIPIAAKQSPTQNTQKSSGPEPIISQKLDPEIHGEQDQPLILQCQVQLPFTGTVEWHKNDIKQSKYRRGQVMAYDPTTGTAILTIEELNSVRHNKSKFKCVFTSEQDGKFYNSQTECRVFVEASGYLASITGNDTQSSVSQGVDNLKIEKKESPEIIEEIKEDPNFVQHLPDRVLFDEGKLVCLSVIVDKNFDQKLHDIVFLWGLDYF